MKKILFLLCVIFSVSTALAQNSISGTVTDSNNQPLPGASVIEKGTSNGATSDFDGNFTLTVGDNATLVVSFVGYKSKEVAVGG